MHREIYPYEIFENYKEEEGTLACVLQTSDGFMFIETIKDTQHLTKVELIRLKYQMIDKMNQRIEYMSKYSHLTTEQLHELMQKDKT